MNVFELQRRAVQKAWKDACAFDGIDPASSAVVFSKDNPFVSLYNCLLLGYQNLHIEWAALDDELWIGAER